MVCFRLLYCNVGLIEGCLDSPKAVLCCLSEACGRFGHFRSHSLSVFVRPWQIYGTPSCEVPPASPRRRACWDFQAEKTRIGTGSEGDWTSRSFREIQLTLNTLDTFLTVWGCDKTLKERKFQNISLHSSTKMIVSVYLDIKKEAWVKRERWCKAF